MPGPPALVVNFRAGVNLVGMNLASNGPVAAFPK